MAIRNIYLIIINITNNYFLYYFNFKGILDILIILRGLFFFSRSDRSRNYNHVQNQITICEDVFRHVSSMSVDRDTSQLSVLSAW